MPGLVKIGRTTGDLATRLRQLDTTAIPVPFECFCAFRVQDVAYVERRLHAAFGDHRVRQNREFFRIGPDRVRAALDLARGTDVTPSDDVVQTIEDRAALNHERQRRSQFRFSLVGLPPGKILTSDFDEQQTAEVIDDRKIRFRGEITSLSGAAAILARENGYNWTAVSGPSWWRFNGRTLDEMRQGFGDTPNHDED